MYFNSFDSERLADKIDLEFSKCVNTKPSPHTFRFGVRVKQLNKKWTWEYIDTIPIGDDHHFVLFAIDKKEFNYYNKKNFSWFDQACHLFDLVSKNLNR